jgi:hypothetical protein
MVISNFQILYEDLTLYLDNYDFHDKLDELSKLFDFDKDEDFLLNELKVNNTNNKE